jgi:hypothetical protein
MREHMDSILESFLLDDFIQLWAPNNKDGHDYLTSLYRNFSDPILKVESSNGHCWLCGTSAFLGEKYWFAHVANIGIYKVCKNFEACEVRRTFS